MRFHYTALLFSMRTKWHHVSNKSLKIYTKEVIRSRKSKKDRQHIGQKKKDKQ